MHPTDRRVPCSSAIFPDRALRLLRTALLSCWAASALPMSAQSCFHPEAGLTGTGIPSRTRVLPLRVPGSARAGAPAEFQVSYTGFTPAAQAAFAYAASLWEQELLAPIPVHIDAVFAPLPGATLGRASLSLSSSPAPAVPGALYPVALVNQQTGCDVSPLSAEITIQINSAAAWYTGTDANPGPAEYDLVTVVLHEIGHGLGMAGSLRYDDGAGAAECSGLAGTGCIVGAPFILDAYTVDAGSTPLTAYTNYSGALGGALTSNALFFSGPAANAAYGGANPPLYAPAVFQPGSSHSHLDEAVFPAGDPNSLMTPQLGTAEAIHDPGPVFRAMLEDFGWTLANVPSAGFSVRDAWVVNKPLQFSDRSALASAWAWDFGDGSPLSPLQHPAHVYAAPGIYPVTLTLNGNPTLTATQNVQVAAQPLIPYFNDFEAGDGAFYPYSAGCDRWEWGAATTTIFNAWAPIGGAANWVTNLSSDHGTQTRYYLEMPPIDFLGAIGDYFLRFDYQWAASTDAGFNVQYSLDGGLSWNVLGGLQGTDPDADADWYNTASIAALDGQPGWAYPVLLLSDVVIRPSYRINAIVNNPDVRLRIQFGAGSASAFEGVQIDNFELQGAVLPETFLDLRAEALPGGTVLRWQAGDARYAAAYEVLRSADGQEFELLASQPAGSGGSYAYTDRSPLNGTSWYRIRQVSRFGTAALSPAAEVLRSGPEQLRLFPNPAQDAVQISGPDGLNALLVLYSPDGREVRRMRAAPGSRIPLSGLSPGLYGYRLGSTQGTLMIR
ncbi:MAG: PKD domain-containing protein [Bacteroidia bacterium]|nr:PKD domain-containing protein [Bacteroidia bacterium]